MEFVVVVCTGLMRNYIGAKIEMLVRRLYRILRLEGESAKVGIETGVCFNRSPPGGLGACPLRKFLKNRCAETDSEALWRYF